MTCSNENCEKPATEVCAHCGKGVCDGGLHAARSRVAEHTVLVCRSCARKRGYWKKADYDTFPVNYVVACRPHGITCELVEVEQFETEDAAMAYQAEADSFEAITAGCMPYPFGSGV